MELENGFGLKIIKTKIYIKLHFKKDIVAIVLMFWNLEKKFQGELSVMVKQQPYSSLQGNKEVV